MILAFVALTYLKLDILKPSTNKKKHLKINRHPAILSSVFNGHNRRNCNVPGSLRVRFYSVIYTHMIKCLFSNVHEYLYSLGQTTWLLVVVLKCTSAHYCSV